MRGLSSLRLRLLAVVLGGLALGLAVATLGFFMALRASLLDDATSVAQERAEARANLLAVEGGDLGAADRERLRRLDSDLTWVVSPSGAVTGPTHGDVLDDVRAVGMGAPARTAQRLRLASTPLVIDGRRRGAVVAAASMRPYDDTMHAAQAGAVALVALVVLGMAVAAWWLLRSALDPVARMTRDASSWSVADLDRRFGLGPPRDELTALAATLDDLLDRIAAGLRHERSFTSEISHELRTPLARITAQAELGRASSDGATAGAFDAILGSASRMDATLTALLAAGRAQGGADACAAPSALARVAREHQSDARERGVALSVAPAAGAGPRVAVATEVVERALSPLVSNALRHASSRVTLSARAVGQRVEFTVADDGDGLPDDEREAVFAPGARGRDARGPGSGLGLPLARRLARAAGGDVTAEGGPGGRFVVSLPAERAATRSGSDQT